MSLMESPLKKAVFFQSGGNEKLHAEVDVNKDRF